jgi:NAD(P)-dependent dehydrogenase (short-subunit alcohol dehydrogenase family)
VSERGQPVVVVTGGGAGIGAAVAEELGRTGWYVVTVDPLVTLDGSERLPEPQETTAGRIVAAGGSARASSISVTDRDAVNGLFDELVDELGRLDAVVNVAGISRPTSFTRGTEEDWLGVLTVHLDGYLNVLAAALPIMAAAGRGRILGVTSGSGWRQADTGAYGCAKRAVASLTWQLGVNAPTGVSINAMSPIAVTRMVTAALEAARGKSPSTSSTTGGLSLGSMPEPEALGPTAAHLVDEAFAWCSGEVIFVGGSEVAVIDQPRLLEVVRTDNAASVAHLLEEAAARVLAPAEANQTSKGGTNPRLGAPHDSPGDLPPAAVTSCAIVTDRPEVAAVVSDALTGRGVKCTTIDATALSPGFAAAASALAPVVDLDAVVVALAGPPAAIDSTPWERILAEHAGIVEHLRADATWARAVADHAIGSDRAVRLVTLTDAVTSGGRSRAQASAHHARSSRGATGDRVSAFAVSVEAPGGDLVGELVAHLLCSPESVALSGAELVAGDGWFGLRSHPRPIGSVNLGGTAVPPWLDDVLRSTVGVSVGEGAR